MFERATNDSMTQRRVEDKMILISRKNMMHGRNFEIMKDAMFSMHILQLPPTP